MESGSSIGHFIVRTIQITDFRFELPTAVSIPAYRQVRPI